MKGITHPSYTSFSSNDPMNYSLGVLQGTGKTPQQQVNFARNAIDDAFSGYDDSFYRQRAQSYIDYAMPKLAEQYRGAQSQLGYSLQDRGLGGSSTSKRLKSSLATENMENRTQVVDTGLGQAQALRAKIDEYKSQLLGQLYQGARPGYLSQTAYDIANRYRAANPITPLANMFSDWMGQAGNLPGMTPSAAQVYNMINSGAAMNSQLNNQQNGGFSWSGTPWQ